MGFTILPLTPDERKQADVNSGLLVEKVGEGPAAAGIRPGDTILAVNGDTVSRIEELRSLISRNGKRVALLILRGNQQLFIPLNIG